MIFEKAEPPHIETQIRACLAEGKTMLEVIGQAHRDGIRTFDLLNPIMAVTGRAESPALQLVSLTTEFSHLICRSEDGTIAPPECAHSLLFNLLESDFIESELQLDIDRFPEPVRRCFADELQIIRSSGYSWEPYLLGPGGHFTDPAKLRRICELLGASSSS